MKFKNYYEVMGLSRDASPDDVKRAYRRLARKYHPDVSKEPDAEERFKELGEAYEVLKDSEKRAAYDQLGANWKAGQEFKPPPDWRFDFGAAQQPGGFSDFFEELFGGLGMRHGSSPQPSRGFDSFASIDLTLDEAFRGSSRTLSLERIEQDGNGQSHRRVRQLAVRIPAGITDGQQIRLAGQGEAALAGGRRGDLYLRARILPHRWFRPDGRDVWLELPITPWEAALGETVRVPTLSGKVDMKIPKNSQSGGQLRLKGRGLPGKPPGDQHVILKIVTPPAETPEDESLYRKLASTMKLNPREAMEE
ncbi:MAG TPA: DnaJ C-terminal domain-containing protein [Gammaproteobacteria bacterium]|jgi:curved DNA-binding protein